MTDRGGGALLLSNRPAGVMGSDDNDHSGISFKTTFKNEATGTEIEWSLLRGSFTWRSEGENFGRCDLKRGVISHQGGLSPRWSVIRKSCQPVGLSSG